MIGIPNLVSLSLNGLCVLVGREIGLWVVGIVGLFFLDLFDVCILKAFFLAFNMENFVCVCVYVYIYMVQALNNLQGLICHKTQPTN